MQILVLSDFHHLHGTYSSVSYGVRVGEHSGELVLAREVGLETDKFQTEFLRGI